MFVLEAAVAVALGLFLAPVVAALPRMLRRLAVIVLCVTFALVAGALALDLLKLMVSRWTAAAYGCILAAAAAGIFRDLASQASGRAGPAVFTGWK